jgi:DNA-binding CsgD family transcriptional regulator
LNAWEFKLNEVSMVPVLPRSDRELANALSRVLAQWEASDVGKKQIQVIWLMAAGRTDQTIAKQVGCSQNYVRKLISIYRKLGPDRFIDRARRATRGRSATVTIERLEVVYREILLADSTEDRKRPRSLATLIAHRLDVAPFTVRRAMANPEFAVMRDRVLRELLPNVKH